MTFCFQYRKPVQDMIHRSFSYTEARAKLAQIWDAVVGNREAILLQRRGKEDVVLLPASEWAGLMETAHLLRSPRNAERLQTARARAFANEGHPETVDALKTSLDLDEDG